MSLEGQTNDAHMQDAFRDLEVLMVRAGEMVRLRVEATMLLPPLKTLCSADGRSASRSRSTQNSPPRGAQTTRRPHSSAPPSSASASPPPPSRRTWCATSARTLTAWRGS